MIDPIANHPMSVSADVRAKTLQDEISVSMIKQALAKGAGRVYLEELWTAPNGRRHFEAYGYAGPHFITPSLPLEGSHDDLKTTLLFVAFYLENDWVWVYEARDADDKEIEQYALARRKAHRDPHVR